MKFTSTCTLFLASAACLVGTTEAASLRGGGAGPEETHQRRLGYHTNCTSKKVDYGSVYTIQHGKTKKYLCSNSSGRKVNFYSTAELIGPFGLIRDPAADWLKHCRWEAESPRKGDKEFKDHYTEENGGYKKEENREVGFRSVGRSELGDDNYLRPDGSSTNNGDGMEDATLGQVNFSDFKLIREKSGSDCADDENVKIKGEARDDGDVELNKKDSNKARFASNGDHFIVSKAD